MTVTAMMTVVRRTIAGDTNQSTVALMVRDLKICMDMPVSRRRKNIRAGSGAIATGSRWAAVTNTGATATKIATNMTEAAKDTGAAAGKTSTTSAAVTAI